jgi:hypothetical protein
MLNTVRDSLGHLACSEAKEDAADDEEDDDDDTELRKLSGDDEPGWVMGTISKTVHHHIESFWQNQMRLGNIMQPG